MRLMKRAAFLLTASIAMFTVSSAMQARAAVAPSAQDRAFLRAAHQSNLAEIAAGKAALRAATTDMVRRHGQQVLADHTRLDADLKTVAQRLGVSLPAEPGVAQTRQLAAVSARSGAAFDSAWIAQQIAGHEAARAAVEAEIAEGSDADVMTLARDAEPVVRTHLSMLRVAAGGSSSPTAVDAGTGGQAAAGAATLPRLGGLLLVLAVALAGAGAAVLRPRRGE